MFLGTSLISPKKKWETSWNWITPKKLTFSISIFTHTDNNLTYKRTFQNLCYILWFLNWDQKKKTNNTETRKASKSIMSMHFFKRISSMSRPFKHRVACFFKVHKISVSIILSSPLRNGQLKRIWILLDITLFVYRCIVWITFICP